MSETKNPGEKTLSVTSTKTLTLKRGVEQGVVRQSFSHGRTKPVVVEKVKRRGLGPETKPAETPPSVTEARAPSGRRVAGKAGAASAAGAGADAGDAAAFAVTGFFGASTGAGSAALPSPTLRRLTFSTTTCLLRPWLKLWRTTPVSVRGRSVSFGPATPSFFSPGFFVSLIP